jgi:hypothetical protein
MYWFPDIESARALERFWSESPHSRNDDSGPAGNRDQPIPPVAAKPLVDEPTKDDVATGCAEAPR